MQTQYLSDTIRIGNLLLGGREAVRIQSMTNTDTMDTMATVAQVMALADAGCEMVRITAPGNKEARNLANIKDKLIQKGYTLPLIADIHYMPEAAEIAAEIVEKVRINPGNYTDKNIGKLEFTKKEQQIALDGIRERLYPLLTICKKQKTAIRIGVNHGSLSERIMSLYGNTPRGMVASAMEFIEICRKEEFHDLVISMKSSQVKVMTDAVRLLVEEMQLKGYAYPLHLGVTEAGNGSEGRILSAMGIGSLLMDGIGNTIRVSLTENPVNEIEVAQQIIQAAGGRSYTAQFIACPSCGRTKYDIQKALEEVKVRTRHLAGLKIAVMGCIVNGPGEMADADYGYIGAGAGLVHLYRGRECVRKNVHESEAVEALVQLIEQDRV